VPTLRYARRNTISVCWRRIPIWRLSRAYPSQWVVVEIAEHQLMQAYILIASLACRSGELVFLRHQGS
jgi:hypothetical protein